MSGRYGNYKGGCGGCGGVICRVQGSSTPRTIHTKKTVKKHFFYVLSSKKSLYYEITAELFANHIKKTSHRVNTVSDAF